MGKSHVRGKQPRVGGRLRRPENLDRTNRTFSPHLPFINMLLRRLNARDNRLHSAD